MAEMIWDVTGERYFQAGIKKVALFKMNNGVYGVGVPWSGVSKVSESPDGADSTDLWADDIKYGSFRAAEKFGGSIECYNFPDEWAECNGVVFAAPGVSISMQNRKTFGLAYITTIGSDTDGFDAGYKLHLVYNGTCSPASADYETINDSPDAGTFSFDFETTPINVSGLKPTAHIEISSITADPDKLQELEGIIYGTANSEPRLPLPDEVVGLMGSGAKTYFVKLNPVGGIIANGKNITSYMSNMETAITLPTADDVTKSGFTFAGWKEVNDLSTTVTTIPVGSTGDKEYIATWTET